jgi:hypothetical protein
MKEGHPGGGVLAVQLRPLRVQALHDEVEGLHKQDTFLRSGKIIININTVKLSLQYYNIREGHRRSRYIIKGNFTPSPKLYQCVYNT